MSIVRNMRRRAYKVGLRKELDAVKKHLDAAITEVKRYNDVTTGFEQHDLMVIHTKLTQARGRVNSARNSELVRERHQRR